MNVSPSPIAIVIRTRNEALLLARTLDAILAQTEQSFDLVIVDSGSTDGTLEIARRYPRVKIIEISPSEFTYGRAINIGISAVADRVAIAILLSAHAIPASSFWLAELVAPFRKDPEVAGVYGRQIPLPEHLGNRMVRALAAHAYRQCYGEESYITKTNHFFSNSNSAISIRHWQTTRFDEHLPYMEDWCWARTILQQGFQIAYAAKAAVYHSHPDSIRAHFQRRRKELFAAMILGFQSRLGMRALPALMAQTWKSYAREAGASRHLGGQHFDCAVLRTVDLLAWVSASRAKGM